MADETTTPAEGAPAGDAAPAAAVTPPTTLLTDATPPASAPPIEPPKPFQWADEKGQLSEGWQEKLAKPELRTDKTLGLYKTFDDLAEAFVQKAKLVGTKLAMPKADDPPEKWDNWRKITGAPDAPAGYGSLRPDTAPPELWDVGLEAKSQAIAHKWGIQPDALKELAAAQAESLMGQVAMSRASEEQQIAAGKAELQQAFGDDYLRQMNYAKTAALAMGFDPNDPADRAFFMNPKAIQNFARAHAMGFAGDRKVEGSPAGLGAGIDDQIAAHRNSPAYLGKEGSERQQQAQKFLHQLYEAKEQMKKAS